VGDKPKYNSRQTAVPAPKPQQQQPQPVTHQQQQRATAQPARQPAQHQEAYPSGLDDILDSYTASNKPAQANNVEVTNDDLNALLDELGGY
jgi:hypothetical protein